MFAPKRILVPTDFSAFSEKALKEASDIAKQYQSSLYVLHVIGVIRQCSGDYCIDGATIDNLRQQSMKSAQDNIAEQIRKTPGAKDIEIVPHIREGVPDEEIRKEQEESGIDLIVIASRGKTGLLGHLGSVTDKVARGAGCHVLIVREK